MNIHELRPTAHMQAGRDPRLDRVKLYLFPFDAVVQMMNANGGNVPKVAGWTVPEDEAVIIGAAIMPVAGQMCIALTVHSPRFPLVLQQPPVVAMSGEWRALPEGVTWDDLPHAEAPDAAPA